jgi:hypothetical protein
MTHEEKQEVCVYKHSNIIAVVRQELKQLILRRGSGCSRRHTAVGLEQTAAVLQWQLQRGRVVCCLAPMGLARDRPACVKIMVMST